MKLLRLSLPLVVLLLIALPASAGHFHSCEYLNYIAHGTFSQAGECLQFTPDPSLEIPEPVPFDIVNQGSWKDGMVGTTASQKPGLGGTGQDIDTEINNDAVSCPYS